MAKKEYYITGVDNIHQLVETPKSKERTEKHRFLIALFVSAFAGLAAVVSAIASIVALING